MSKLFRSLEVPRRLALTGFLADHARSATACVAQIGLTLVRVSSHLACFVACEILAMRRPRRVADCPLAEPGALRVVHPRRLLAAHTAAASIAACPAIEGISGGPNGGSGSRQGTLPRNVVLQ